jgi:3-hydroxyisobutyrate dehydrogenase
MAGETVAVLGTGTMGGPMARNIGRDGYDVRVWNRTRATAEAAADGATVAASAEEAAAGAAFVLTMLADGDAVEAVFPAIRPGTVWIQSSTIGIEATDRLAGLAAERGIAYLDAPVLGTKAPAEKGELVVLVSGPDEERRRARPIFEAIGKKTLEVGERREASRLKLVINLWVISLNEAAAESIALAEALGLDPRLFLDALEGSPTGSPYLRLKGDAIVERRLDPSFRLELAAKDARLVAEAAAAAGLALPLAEAVRRQLERAAELGHGDDDMAATYFASTRS